jgi:SPP1 gp7 family putative phage head morphogenesis protein
MPRWPWQRAPRADEPDTTKAARIGPAATFTPQQVASLLASVTVGGQTTGALAPLPRSDPQVAFGPGVPLIPGAIDPLRPDTGRPEPRFNEYPVSANLPGVTDRLVPWKVLRDAAGIGGLPRRCIEIRKNDVLSFEWGVIISKGAVETAQRENPSTSRADIETELHAKLAPQIVRCTQFWAEPDKGQGQTFTDWLSALLEEHLVLDAVALYPRRSRGGDLWALEVIAGDTIKVLRDHRGGRPQPPQPAYQQILWGFPRGEYVADVDENGIVIDGYTADRLIYRRRNVRVNTVYGYSATEQALEDIDVWLQRRGWLRAEYTDGSVPRGMIRNTGQAQWTPQQIREYERDVNDTYSGQTPERLRLRVLPPGFELETYPDNAEKYKPEYDLFLIKLVASHFGVTLAELGFSEAKGLGSTGWHEGQADVQERQSTLPTVRWLEGLLTDISRKHLGMPPELEFRFLGLEDEDEAAADQVAQQRIQYGRMTLNEDRDRLGLPRYEFDEADKPMIVTQRGIVFMEHASELEPAGTMVQPPQAAPQRPAGDGQGGAGEEDPKPGEADPAGEGENDDGEGGKNAPLVKAELAAYTRWRRKNPTPHRPFEFQVVTKADAPHLAGDQHAQLAEAVPDPKAPAELDSARQWPGWERDLDTAAVWVPRIRRAMRNAIDTRALATEWLALRKADEPDLPDFEAAAAETAVSATVAAEAVAWLTARGANPARALSFIADLWTEGWTIGHLASQAMLMRTTVDWSAWKPGDVQAARLVLDEAGRVGLAGMLDEAGVTINSIAGNRLNQLARELAAALERGDSPATLARALRGILEDPQWADMVAVTELNRAMSRSTRDTYARNGIEMMQWLSAEDPRVCQDCSDNEDAGPTPLNDIFPSGASLPPAHPSCRCCITPVVVSRAEAGPAALATADDE